MTEPIQCYHCKQMTTFGIDGHAEGCPVPELIAIATADARKPAGGGPDVRSLYRQMSEAWLRDLRRAFELDASGPNVDDETFAFCVGRMTAIDQVLGERRQRDQQRES